MDELLKRLNHLRDDIFKKCNDAFEKSLHDTGSIPQIYNAGLHSAYADVWYDLGEIIGDYESPNEEVI